MRLLLMIFKGTLINGVAQICTDALVLSRSKLRAQVSALWILCAAIPLFAGMETGADDIEELAQKIGVRIGHFGA